MYSDAVRKELKPCPFCGGEAELNCKKFNGGFIVECSDQSCPASYMLGAIFDTLQEAIAAWNTRAEPEARALTIEELKARNGKPVWWEDICDTPFDENGWAIISLDALPRPWYSYGKSWVAYDHEPGKDGE